MRSEYPVPKPHRRPKRAALAAVCLGLAFTCATAGIGLADTAKDGAEADAGVEYVQHPEAAPATSEGIADFTEPDAGLYPDTYTNTEVLNAGNRGCNSCHEDLWETASNVLATDDIATLSGGGHIGTDRWDHYGRKGTVLDCIGCHSGRTQNTGPYLGDSIHSIHYASDAFLDSNGNCWSCHAIRTDEMYTDTDQYEFELWEEQMYNIDLGGYPGIKSSEEMKQFLQERGYSSYLLTEVSVDEDPDISVEMDQKLTPTEDIYVIDNYAFDYADIKDEITVTGVVDARTLSLDELKSLPQTTRRVTEECVLNDINGLLCCNIEVTGVTLADLVDALGGFADPNTNGMVAHCYDDWSKTFGSDRDFLEDTILALQYNGEDISDANGAPGVLILPGTLAGMWSKHIESLDFQVFEQTPTDADALWFLGDTPRASTTTYNLVNAAWFENDGLEFTMDEGVTLTGYAYGWSYYGDLSTIQFSTDMGQTWETFNVPPSHDSDQWTTFTLHWNPPAPGTYIVKVSATNDSGDGMKDPGCASIIVTVTE